MFPEQEFFTLAQISSQWGVEVDNIQQVIMSGKLKAHLWIERTLVHKVEPDSYIEPAMVSGAMHIDNHIGLFAHDCRKLFVKGKAIVRKFPADNLNCYRLTEYMPAIELEHDNIIILRDEKHRFEAEHRIGKDSSPVFTYFNNFQDVSYSDYHFHFGKIQASIVQQLYDALQTDNPWLYGKTLLKNADSKTNVMHNIFKHKKHWQKLIESNGKGFYRLSSDIAAPS